MALHRPAVRTATQDGTSSAVEEVGDRCASGALCHNRASANQTHSTAISLDPFKIFHLPGYNHFICPAAIISFARLRSFQYLGFLFESMVHRDLSVYGAACDAEVFHYRDNTNLEVDMVVQNRRGDWCAFEVKLGAGQVDAAAESLLRMRDRLDLGTVGEPETLGVIVGSGYGYRRPDGIAVIPIAALGP